MGNKSGPTRLGFAVFLKFLQYEGRFPQHPYDIPARVVEYVARQVEVAPDAWAHDDWHGRSIESHRAQMRAQLECRASTVEDGEALIAWLCAHVLATTQQGDHLMDAVYGW